MRVLVVSQTPELSRCLRVLLPFLGHDADAATNSDDLTEALNQRPQALLVDPASATEQLLLAADDCGIPTFLLDDGSLRASEVAIPRRIMLPFDPDELRSALSAVSAL